MKSLAAISVVLLVLVPAGCLAQSQNAYFNLGLAIADAGYPGFLENELADIEDLPGVDHIQIGLDFGLYLPINPGLVGGPAITIIGDRYSGDGEHMQINQVLYAASFRMYPSRVIGEGFFVRGDVGFSRMVVDTSYMGTETSDFGAGFLVGVGYSFPIGASTWLSISAEYTTKSIEDETVSGTTIGAALLF